MGGKTLDIIGHGPNSIEEGSRDWGLEACNKAVSDTGHVLNKTKGEAWHMQRRHAEWEFGYAQWPHSHQASWFGGVWHPTARSVFAGGSWKAICVALQVRASHRLHIPPVEVAVLIWYGWYRIWILYYGYIFFKNLRELDKKIYIYIPLSTTGFII